MLHGAYDNYYYALQLQASDGVIGCLLFAEFSPMLCQARKEEGRFGELVNRNFFRYLGFRLSTVEGGACTNVHARMRIGFLPDGPGRLYWLTPPRLQGAYGNYYYVIQLHASGGVMRRVLCDEYSPILCHDPNLTPTEA